MEEGNEEEEEENFSEEEGAGGFTLKEEKADENPGWLEAGGDQVPFLVKSVIISFLFRKEQHLTM